MVSWYFRKIKRLRNYVLAFILLMSLCCSLNTIYSWVEKWDTDEDLSIRSHTPGLCCSLNTIYSWVEKWDTDEDLSIRSHTPETFSWPSWSPIYVFHSFISFISGDVEGAHLGKIHPMSIVLFNTNGLELATTRLLMPLVPHPAGWASWLPTITTAAGLRNPCIGLNRIDRLWWI